MILIERLVHLFCLKVYRSIQARFGVVLLEIYFVFFELFPSYLFGDLHLLFLFKLHNPLLDNLVFILFVALPAIPYCFPDLVEPADDILCYLQL